MNKVIAACAGALALASATPAAAQKSADTLRFPFAESGSTLDTYLNPGTFSNVWGPSVYDHLLGFDPKKGDFVGHLAKSWAQPDPTTYEYELHEDTLWHDGQKVDADDVVYTLNYLIDPKVTLRYKAYWAWIKSVEKLGPYKIRITSKQPVPDGMMWMVFRTPIYPEHLHGPLANKQDFGAKPVGTGPYRITQLDKNAGIHAEKYANYRARPEKPGAAIGKIVADPMPDLGTQVAALLTGKADIAADLPADQAADLAKSGKFEVSLSPPAMGYTFLGFPSKGADNVKALSDPRVRTAIAKAINRQQLVDIQYGELAKGMKPAEALCSREQLGCAYTKLVPDYDPAGAKKLLAEAGYADGFDLAISTFPQAATQATAMAGMLRAVGIRAVVRQHTIAQRVQLLAEGKVDVGLYNWAASTIFEVSPQIVRHFQSKEYDDPLLAKMADEVLPMMNDAERRKAAAKLFDYATEKGYAFAMVPTRAAYTHTKEVRLAATGLRATEVNPHEFAWK
jgi:peptide/nickel transport system substrate-binding protein